MTWRPDASEALKHLIRQTIKAAGPIDPATLPHHLRERLRAQASGDAELDACIAEVIAEMRRQEGRQ